MDIQAFDSNSIRKLSMAAASSQALGYHISDYNIPELWQTTQGEGVRVAVLDTGAQHQHKDIRHSFRAGMNMTNNQSIRKIGQKINTLRKELKNSRSLGQRRRIRNAIAQEIRGVRRIQNKFHDKNGHGTFVTGLITANRNNFGVVGVAPQAEVLPIKVLNDSGGGSYQNLIDGIYYAIRKKADIINLSLGGEVNDWKVGKAIMAAYKKGIPCICAAGNAGNTGKLSYPAQYKQTISVGAVDRNQARAWFSQTGSRLDVMAAGVGVLSTIPYNRYARSNGTSMATPIVSGIVALMIAKHRKHGGSTPINGVEDIREHLKKIATDIGDLGHDNQTGYGLIDPSKLFD